MKTLFASLLFVLPFLLTAQQEFKTGYQDQAGANRVPSAEIEIAPTADALQATLYELTDEYYAVHQLHWNVTGPLFYPLHELYQEFYEALSAKIDEVAERKLALDRPADARPSAVAENANLSPATPAGFTSDKESLQILTARHLQLSDRLAERITATGETDMVTQGPAH